VLIRDSRPIQLEVDLSIYQFLHVASEDLTSKAYKEAQTLLIGGLENVGNRVQENHISEPSALRRMALKVASTLYGVAPVHNTPLQRWYGGY